jgi:hypothetical protein
MDSKQRLSEKFEPDTMIGVLLVAESLPLLVGF